MNTHEIREMNVLMKSLESDVEKMAAFNQKLVEITAKQEKLAEFYTEKWMEYYEMAEEFNGENLEILNQDSLWNVLADTDIETRKLIKSAAKLL